jgi:hypothetical protein
VATNPPQIFDRAAFKRKILLGSKIILGVVVITGIILAITINMIFFQPMPQPPSLNPTAVFRPVMVLRNPQKYLEVGWSYKAGTGFVVQQPSNSQNIFVTALHLFGPAAGLNTEIPPFRLNREIKTIFLVEFGSNEPSAQTTQNIFNADLVHCQSLILG